VPDHARNKTVQLNIRVSPELGERIDALAQQEGRSRANWVERTLEIVVANGGKKNRRKGIDSRQARG
jgi:predicted HicB family RNase H-like nuclease